MALRDYINYAGGWVVPAGVLAVGTISGVLLYGKFKSGELSFGGRNLETEIGQKQSKLESLEMRLPKVKQRLAERIKKEEEAEMFAVMQAELKQLKEENAAAQGQLDSLRKGLDDIAEMFSDYRERYRRHVRAEAAGTKLDELTTLEGRTYHKVEIKSVGALGVNVTHRDGSARIPFKQLPESMQRKFQFDEEEAKAQLKWEEEMRRRRELALAALENPTLEGGGNSGDSDNGLENASDEARTIANIEAAIEQIEERIKDTEKKIAEESRKTVSRAPIFRQELEKLEKTKLVYEAKLRQLKSGK